jgi:outer membrane protein assembly factor BamB
MRTLAALATCVLTLAAAMQAAEPNWPQWRGPAGQGVSTETSLPTAWSPSDRIAWKTPVPGRAHSSPIVWGNRVFLTTAIEGAPIEGHQPLKHYISSKEGRQEWRHPEAVAGNQRHTFQVIALDAADGKTLWTRTAYEGPVYDDRHRKSSYAAHTPATDGTLVYAYFGTEGLYAYRFDGTLAWSAQLGKLGAMSVGTGTSVVLFDRLVIIQADEDNGDASFIAALDKTTGKEVWRVRRPGISISWATPVLAGAGDETQLVTAANEHIVSYDPRTGRELWRERGLQNNAIPSPLVAGDLVIVSAGYPQKKTMAFRLKPENGTKRLAWEFTKGTAYVTSPIIYGDHIYLSTDGGILTCLDVRTGELKYEGGRPPVPATFMASPVAFGGHLYMTSEDGDTFVIKAGPAFEVVRTNSIGEPVFASPALANSTVYIRGEKHLFAIR